MNKLKTLTFATLIAVGSTWATAQESAPETSMQNTAQAADRDDTDWGWIGLVGLAGLLGLKRKDREPEIRTANRTI
jgi:hypothetical protein